MPRMFYALVLLGAALCAAPSLLHADKAVIIAGGGAKNGPVLATDAKLSDPFGVDFDKAGNMYIVDYVSHQIYKVDAKGVLTTTGGTGKKGDAGDGGPVIKAEFNKMHGLVILPDDNLCLADSFNNRLRKLDLTSGIVSAYAGTGNKGFSGDGGPALKADFGNVYSVCLDPKKENLYVADLDNRRIRKIALASGIVTTAAGNGQKAVPNDGDVALNAPLYDPRAVAVDKKGNMWILERYGNAVRVVDAQGKIRTAVGMGGKAGLSGDGGDAVKAQLNLPRGMCLDLDDNVLIADTGNHVIRKLIVNEGKIVRVAGTGKKGSAGAGGDALSVELNEPHGVFVHPSGALYISDSSNHRVLRLEK